MTVDGIPLRDIDLKAWRHKIGYVPQEMLLLHETIVANVTLGDTELTGNDVRNALEAAEAWVAGEEALPHGMYAQRSVHIARRWAPEYCASWSP